MSAWGDLIRFSVPERTEKIAGLRYARGDSTQTDAMLLNINILIQIIVANINFESTRN